MISVPLAAMVSLKRHAALALGLALGVGPAAAQTVGGSVAEQGSGAAVAGATVLLRQLGGTGRASAMTDATGAFVMLLAGRSARYIILVSHPSYVTFQDTLQLSSQEAVTLQLQLGRDAIALQPLVVKARMQRRLQGYYDRLNRGTGFGRFLTHDDLERIPANRTTDYLRRIPGIRLERVNGGNLVTIANPLGACTPLIYVDGMPIEQRGPDEVDDLLEPLALEGIEFYAGVVGLPLEFAGAQQTGCGVVAFWTRDPGGRSLTWMRLAISVGAVAAFIVTSWKILL